MSDMAIEAGVRKIKVAEYHRMVEHGILRDDERVELLDGIIVQMSPIGRRHRALHTRILRYLNARFGDRASVSGDISVPLGDYNEPEPDIAIWAPEPSDYFYRDSTLDEVLALIEIADSSLDRDLGRKRDLYARFEIREYLLVDIEARTLVRFTNPVAGRYQGVQELTYGDTFSLSALPDVELASAEFLPPPYPA